LGGRGDEEKPSISKHEHQSFMNLLTYIAEYFAVIYGLNKTRESLSPTENGKRKEQKFITDYRQS